MPGQEPRFWTITRVEQGRTATIEMELDGAVFYNRIVLEVLAPDQTEIRQIMSLAGSKASDFAAGMEMFESNAPQGLAKLAEAIELAYQEGKIA